MVHGSWFMVHGSWLLVHGSWFMARGLWFTVHGSWFMVSGSRSIVHGSWFLAATLRSDFETSQWQQVSQRKVFFLVIVGLRFCLHLTPFPGVGAFGEIHMDVRSSLEVLFSNLGVFHCILQSQSLDALPLSPSACPAAGSSPCETRRMYADRVNSPAGSARAALVFMSSGVVLSNIEMCLACAMGSGKRW